MKHVWSALCLKSVIDKASNNISLLEVIEEIHASPYELKGEEGNTGLFVPMPIHWVSLWERSNPEIPEKTWIKDTIKLPSGKLLGEQELEVDLLAKKRRRLIRMVPVPPSNELGRYVFETRVKNEGETRWKKVSEVPLEIIMEKDKSEKT